MSRANAVVAALARTLLGVVLAAGVDVSLAAPSALDKEVHFEIPSQSLESALLEFARQAGVSIFFAAAELDRVRAPAVTGTLPVRLALTHLLGETGLSFSSIGDAITVGAGEGAVSPVRSAARASRTPNQGSRASAADQSTTSGESLTEVVVTAQKREERLLDVPISISVLSGDQLDQSTTQGVSEELTRVPGVATFTHTQAGGTVVSVRGASVGGPVFAGSSPVSYYLDAVPFGLVQTAIAPDANAYDLKRVEVLRGPQGTLYGASAQAGVVRVLTKDADLNDYELKLRVSDSATNVGGNNYRGDLAANVPIVEGKLAARAVVGYQNLSGWVDQPIKRNANDAELRNGRIKIDAKPTDSLSIGASVWLARSEYGGLSASNDKSKRDALFDESYSIDYDVYGLKVGYDFSAFSLTSVTSYLKYSSGGNVDAAGLFGGSFHVPLFTGFNAHVFTEELSINSSQEGPWRWTAGAIYRDGRDKNFQTIPSIVTFDWTNTSGSYAAFGELSRRFHGDTLEWTLGGRYFHDDVVSREDQLLAPINPPNYYRAESSFNSTTPRVVLTWRPDSDRSIYASYSEGFRSGTPQSYSTVAGVPGFPSAKPDKLRNYEIGAKGSAGTLIFDAAVYYMDWRDVQQQLSVLFGTTPVSAIVNGESASGVGVDVGITLQPMPGLDVGGSFSWNDLRMDADILSSDVVLFAKGDRPNFSPEYTAGAFADYSFSLGGSGYKGRVSISGNYTARQGFRSVLGGAQVIATGNPMLITRAAFAIRAPARWELTLFGDNLNDARGSVVGNPFFGPDANVRVRPRTFGLQLDYHF